MKLLLYIACLIMVIGCSDTKKTILLPKIQDAFVNDLTDVSPAYIIYDITKKDSLELNRNNLISTTNWLVNVDKRHKLNKAIPSIVLLQNKKRDAKMHKNEAARNYFSCNDISKQTLGFIDFTEVYYKFEPTNSYIKKLGINDSVNEKVVIEFNPENEINIYYPSQHQLRYKGNLSEILEKEVFKNTKSDMIYLAFNGNLSFQEYITAKRKIEVFSENKVNIANTEYIIN